MKNFTLSEKEIKSLRATHKTLKEKWAADRLKAIISLGNGWTLEEVAEILLLDIETLRNYIKAFESGGVEALVERHYQRGFSIR